jgi:GrpB-like predicted nucleotidyltransferase (UPF0157 family)
MLHTRLLFIPLDGRPVCLDFVADLARAAGIDVRTPDRSLLGDRRTPGDVDGIWSWLEREAAGGETHALIAAAEMLCFGGLVASRKSTAPFEDIAPRIRRLEETARRLPAYVSAVIPRTPEPPTEEDAGHWHTRDPEALRAHRDRQFRVNDALIGAAARGAFRYLLIGQDDTTPGSAGAEERARLEARPEVRGARGILLTTGADELNARLLARYLHDLTGLSPAVRVVYTYPQAVDAIPRYESTPLRRTVEEHLASTGCHPAVEAVDVLLWVHNFEGPQAEASDQGGAPPAPLEVPRREVAGAVAEEQVAALADVRFANGADAASVAALLEEPRFAGLVAYGGWNTCSNALGSTLAQAVVAYHLRANTVAGSDRIYRPALFTRILDDWGYQAIVRPELIRWLADRGGDAGELGDLEREAERRASEGFSADVLPRLQSSFRYHPTALRPVTFPWHRLFEVRLDVDVTRLGRSAPGGIIVADYDPAWAKMYERDRAAIVGALGEMVRGIEHVGSTAVPGLAAKPIIDILLGVDADDLDRIIEPLRRIGYEYNPDWEISLPHRRFFRRLLADGTNSHHLHAVAIGTEFWNRHVRFRDYLRANPSKAEEYAALKREIARQHQGSIDYTFAKTEFIRSVESLAGVSHRTRRPPRTPIR